VVPYSLAHFVDVSIERSCTINGDAKASNAFRYGAQIGSEFNSINYTSFFCRTLVPMTGAFDLSGFSDKPFCANKWSTATTQLSSLVVGLVFSIAM